MHERTFLLYEDFRSTYDAATPRGYIDLFIKAQEGGQGEYFTNQDLLTGCQVRLAIKLQ